MLGVAKKQMVEIACAVQHNAGIFILDEPTATLTPEEKQHFFALVEQLKADGGSIIFISHVLALRDGDCAVCQLSIDTSLACRL